ncbi:hypothetical protein T12_6121, partial [Trichinella patagoniensis]
LSCFATAPLSQKKFLYQLFLQGCRFISYPLSNLLHFHTLRAVFVPLLNWEHQLNKINAFHMSLFHIFGRCVNLLYVEFVRCCDASRPILTSKSSSRISCSCLLCLH